MLLLVLVAIVHAQSDRLALRPKADIPFSDSQGSLALETIFNSLGDDVSVRPDSFMFCHLQVPAKTRLHLVTPNNTLVEDKPRRTFGTPEILTTVFSLRDVFTDVTLEMRCYRNAAVVVPPGFNEVREALKAMFDLVDLPVRDSTIAAKRE